MHQRYDLVVTGESLPGRALRVVRADTGRFEAFLAEGGLTATVTDSQADWRYAAIWERTSSGTWVLCTRPARSMPAYASRAIVDDLTTQGLARTDLDCLVDMATMDLPAGSWVDRHPMVGATAIIGTGAVVWSLVVWLGVVAGRMLS